MMTALFAVGVVMQELGLSAAVVQRRELGLESVGTLFWINTGLGVVMAALFAALAPWIALFYARPELTLLCAVTAVTFVFNGLAVQHRAQLQRHMQFGAHARINVLSALAGGAAAMLTAWRGGGVWSLAVQLIVTDLLAWAMLARAAPLRVTRPTLSREVREILHLGLSVFGFQLVYGLASNLYVILLGRSAGAVATGVYTRALALVAVPQSFVYLSAGHVALPKLSSLRDDDVEFASFYYRSLQLITLFSAPTVVLFALFAGPIAICAYGEQWHAVPELLRIFAPGMAVAPILHTTSQVFASRGEGGRFFRWGLFSACVMGATALAGLPWGVQGVAWGWSASGVLLLVPGLRYAFRGTPLSTRRALRACLDAWLAAAGMVPAGLWLNHLLQDVSPWLALPISAAVCVAIYLLLAAFVFGQRALMVEIVQRVFARARR